MPQIIVIADTPGEGGSAQVMHRERVNKRDFESGHFASQLAERLGWAVGDAHTVDQHRRIEARVSAETPQRFSARVVTTAS